jgi:iron complex outermembrane receptor protein
MRSPWPTLGFVAFCATTGTGYAQDERIEELLVTARRVPEAASGLPLATHILLDVDLKRGSVDGLYSLAARAPGLSFESTWGGAVALPTMRGQFSPSLGDTVGVFVDGVYQANRSALDVELLDLARAEVVFGPQSTLYGHTAFAGAIGYVSQEPTPDLAAGAALDAGSADYVAASGWVSGPLADRWLGRIAFSDRAFGGTGRNAADPSDNLGGYRRRAVATSLATYGGGDAAWNAMLTGRYQEGDYEHPSASFVDGTVYDCGSRAAATVMWSYLCRPFPESARVAITPDLPDSATTVGQGSLAIDVRFAGIRFESLTGVYSAQSDAVRDFDATDTGVLYGVCTQGLNCSGPPGTPRFVDRFVVVPEVSRDLQRVRHFSQEFRVRGLQPRFDWMIGAVYYEIEDLGRAKFGAARSGLTSVERLTAILPATPASVGPISVANRALVDDPSRQQVSRQVTETEARSAAVFGTLDYRVNGQLRLRGELRAAHERVSLDSRIVNFQPSFGREIEPQDYDAVTARVSVDLEPAPGWYTFASVARGVRPGGINPIPGLPADQRLYAPDSNWTYEIGASVRPTRQPFEIEGTAYYIDWRDTQIGGFSSRPGLTNFITVNTAGLETWGVALAATIRPVPAVLAELAFNYAEPEFARGSDDPGSATFCGLTAQSFESSFCTVGPPRHARANSPPFVPWLDGNAPGRAPRVTWHGALTFEPRAAIAEWWPWVRLDLNHQDEVFERQIDGATFGERTLLDARAGLSKERWSIELWGTNLTDESYVRASFSRLPVLYPTLPRPLDLIYADGRRYGLTLRWESQ